MTNDLRDQLQKEVEQAKKEFKDASVDAVPFYKKHKKAVIISGVVLVIIVLSLLFIF